MTPYERFTRQLAYLAMDFETFCKRTEVSEMSANALLESKGGIQRLLRMAHDVSADIVTIGHVLDVCHALGVTAVLYSDSYGTVIGAVFCDDAKHVGINIDKDTGPEERSLLLGDLIIQIEEKTENDN